MPVNFLTPEQIAQYGHYAGEPSPAQLARYFYLDDADQMVLAGWEVYAESKTESRHRQFIREQYGYQDFHQSPKPFFLLRQLYARAWLTAEKHLVLFDYATAWLVQNKVLLPGPTVLERLVAHVVERADNRLWERLNRLVDEAQTEQLRTLLTVADLMELTNLMGGEYLFVSVDDSLTEKDKGTTCLQAVDWHHDHTKSQSKKQVYTNGIQHIEVRIQLGEKAYVYDWGLYLREKTVRRLNRKRPQGKRLSFRTKYRIVRAILADLKQRLPAGFPVYVLFDSWYASNKLLKFCRRQSLH